MNCFFEKNGSNWAIEPHPSEGGQWSSFYPDLRYAYRGHNAEAAGH